jgi:hypothetical protein
LHLTTIEPYDIPLILDAYKRGQFGKIDNFIGHVEFLLRWYQKEKKLSPGLPYLKKL